MNSLPVNSVSCMSGLDSCPEDPCKALFDISPTGMGMATSEGTKLSSNKAMSDVTAEKERARQLKENEEKYRTLVEETSDGVYESDLQGAFTFVNGALAHILGYGKPEDAIGLRIAQFLPPHERKRMEEDYRSVMVSGAGKTIIATEIIRRDGASAFVEIHPAVIFKNNRPAGSRGTVLDITERRHLEDKLREERDFINQIVTTMGQGLTVTDAEGRFVFVNPAYARMVGREPENLIGMSPEQLTCIEDHPVLAQAKEDRKSGKVTTYETRLLTGRGNTIPVIVTGVPKTVGSPYTGTIAVVTDITELRRTQSELEQANSLLASTLESTTDGILVVDLAGKIVLSNRKFRELWQIPEEILAKREGRKVMDYIRTLLVDPDSLSREVSMLHDHPGEESFGSFEFTDGRIYEHCVLPLRLNGIVTGRVFSFRDITERKKTEACLEEFATGMERLVSERTKELEAYTEELESFAYSVSHDLRAPLRALDGFSAALLSKHAGQLDRESKHYCSRIQEASRRMGQLINDLLDLSRITRMRFAPEPLNLADMARRIASDLHTWEPERDVAFEIGQTIPATGDPKQVSILMRQLLENAWKFSGRQSPAQIEVGMRVEAGETIYFVKDNGTGFDMKHADRLFAPFQRLHGMNEFPGTGIGLVAAKRIVQRHGGRIWPEAKPDCGAVFSFTLPSGSSGH